MDLPFLLIDIINGYKYKKFVQIFLKKVKLFWKLSLLQKILSDFLDFVIIQFVVFIIGIYWRRAVAKEKHMDYSDFAASL